MLVLACLLTPTPAYADITVRATVDSRQARVGESITLSVSIEGAQNVPAPQVRVSGLETHYVGPSTQVSIINGRVTSSIQHRYSLMGLQPGRFEVGPLTVTYEGKDYSTTPIGIEFVAANAPAAGGAQGAPGGTQGKALYATLTTPKTEVYLHESIPIDVTLYVGAIRVGDLQFPNLTPDGLFIDPFPQPAQSQQVIDGQNYQVVTFHTNAVPLRSGSLSIGPASVRLSVYERGRRGGADPFFDNFFQQGRQTDVRTEPLTLNVLPLPENGRPPDFSGAVGSFTMRVVASPTELTAGDPITVRLEVSGQGNLTDATPPSLVDASGFRPYDPRVTTSDANGRTFEQVLIPIDASVTAVPPFRFSFFDPKAGAYRSLQSQPVALQVRAPQQAPRTDIVAADSGATRKVAEEKLGRDIVFLKDDPGNLVPRAGSASFLWLLLAWLPIPPLLLAGTIWYDNHRRRLRGDERYARFTRAGKQARHGLAHAHQAMTQGQRVEFYDSVATTMREYLSAKLHLPIGAVDADAVARAGVAADCVEELRGFFATCEQARFAPSAGNEDMRATMSTAESIVAKIERERRSAGKRNAAAAVCLLLSLATAVLAAESNEPSSPQTTFFHANSLYRDGNYAEAAKEYEKLVEGGLASSALYFNLGNAFFKAGDRGRAILNYERARRWQPNDPDIEANLSYAQSLTGLEPCEPPLWRALLFPLVDRVPVGLLLAGATVLYSLIFVLLGAQRLLDPAPRWLFSLTVASVLLTLIVGASALQAAHLNYGETHAVIIADGDTAARFEPAENGTVHFTLKQGATVEILDQREAWAQVARCDGRRGWVPRAAASDL